MNQLLYSLLFGLLAYLSGSLAFAVWVTRRWTGEDVRQRGSGHATATNTIRQAGWLPGVVVFVLDILKGFLPVFLAQQFAVPQAALPWIGMLAVVGHCWPIFAGFRGGMGLATTSGVLLALDPRAFLVGLSLLIIFLLVLRHAARASVLTTLVGAPVAWLVGIRGVVIPTGVLMGLVVASRFITDWRRKYRELWLDREKNLEETKGPHHT